MSATRKGTKRAGAKKTIGGEGTSITPSSDSADIVLGASGEATMSSLTREETLSTSVLGFPRMAVAVEPSRNQETSEVIDVSVKYRELGMSLGLREEALARFVVDGIQKEEERREREEDRRLVERKMEEERRKIEEERREREEDRRLMERKIEEDRRLMERKMEEERKEKEEERRRREEEKEEERRRREEEKEEERRRREEEKEEERRRREEEKEDRRLMERKMEEERRRREEEKEEDRRLMERKMEEERRRREEEKEEERRRREEDKEEERRSLEIRMEAEKERMKMQMEVIREEREVFADRSTRREHHDGYRLKIHPFDGREDIEAYLRHFELIAESQGWNRDCWAARLSPLLSGEARDTYLRLTPEQAQDFEEVRNALLRRFRRDAEWYRRQFRETKKEQNETFPQFLIRLQTSVERWFSLADKDIDDAKSVLDMFLAEQIYSVMNPELEMFVRERLPTDAAQAAEYAQLHLDVKRAVSRGPVFQRASPRTPSSQPERRPNESQTRLREPIRRPVVGRDERDRRNSDECYKCGGKGHFARQCMKTHAVSQVTIATDTLPIYTPPIDVRSIKPYNPWSEGRINENTVRIMRDTGAEMGAVASKWVKPEDYTGRSVEVYLADQTKTGKYPTAWVKLESGFVTGTVELFVLDHMGPDILLGNWITFSSGYRSPVTIDGSECAVAAAVETRGQIEREKRATVPLQVSKTLGVEVTPTELAALQEEDDSLKKVRALADAQSELKSGNATVKFTRKKGLLYRLHQLRGVETSQLVVPKKLRKEVMRLAHDPPMAGHLGGKRTRERIWNTFFWPGMCADVRRYCASCIECQRVTPRGRVSKVPLQKMPLMDEPFQRVAIDIVGPIAPKSEQGNQYILVVVDYATRYPEAVPLKRIDTEKVAEALWTIWSRVGIPREILTDRGTQFMSAVMDEMNRLLAIHGKATTPYHPQCNGLVERFNGTLMTMLRKLTTEQPRMWDRYIPALLFAYREVPQEATGFSPFELLYGKTVRGPMAVLRELWSKEIAAEEVKVSSEYVVDLRNRIEETCQIAKEHMKGVAERQKHYFDRKAKPRVFKAGDRVLLLLPTKHNKLQMAWQGPYEVIEKVGECDYRISVGRKTKLFHVNLLKECRERVTVDAVVTEDDQWKEEQVGNDIPTCPLVATEGPKDVHVDPECPEIHEDILNIVSDYADIFTDFPLRCTLDTCEIKMINEEPVRTRQYPLPHSQMQVVKDEVETMMKLRVIERATSPYSSPIVLVKKKDGQIRFCVDFRKMNRNIVFDAEPLPDIDFLFAKLAKAKYLSKIDLSKGYWQIPMKKEDKEKTAFTTPEGQFQWCVMPFGLKTAGAIFSRMMRKLLAPLHMPEIDNFMDDLMIATQTKERHLECLRALCQRLREVQLAARPSKCFLGFQSLEYLGHMVGRGKIQPDRQKMDRIGETSQPTTKKQVRSFLGLASYYRRFVPNFAAIAAPLSDLTKGGKTGPVAWTEACERAFNTLKERLCSSPVCCLPDGEKPFVLQTDASDTGIGAVLCQDQGHGLQPVACVSRKLVAAEKNYSTIEKECLALIWGLQRFQQYVYDRTVIVQTDHQPLKYLQKSKTTSSRLMRWALLMQSFPLVIESIPGKENVTADFLSRNV